MDTEKTEVVAEETAAPATTERTEAAPQQRYNRQNRNNRRKKVCLFCAENISGTCAKHQRQLTVAIKRARHVALLPYVAD